MKLSKSKRKAMNDQLYNLPTLASIQEIRNDIQRRKRTKFKIVLPEKVRFNPEKIRQQMLGQKLRD